MQSESEQTALRILVVGPEKRLTSSLAFELFPSEKVEFEAAAALFESDVSDRAARFDAVLLDAAQLAAADAQAFLERVLRHLCDCQPPIEALALVADGDERTARAAARQGAWDVVSAGPDAARIVERVRALARLRRLRDSDPDPRTAPEGGGAPAEDEEPRQMVGTSDAIRRVFSLIRRVASTDVPVLVTGESGTGKELTALAIHERSARAEAPFVPINCGAIPEALLESELFGHERGAFTGATTTRRGRFEAADRGTLFLDEIGDLAPSLQAKLLRFLEDHVVERVGGRKRLRLDVRVIAATHRDLAAAVEAGDFREDLFYRLAVFTIVLPPLRERGEDPVLMAKFFLERYARQESKAIQGFRPEAVDALQQAQWPGNVRELVNRVRRAVVLCDGALVGLDDLGLEVGDGESPLVTLREARRRAERESIRAALLRTGGNKTDAARALGIGRTQLYELMRRHEL